MVKREHSNFEITVRNQISSDLVFDQVREEVAGFTLSRHTHHPISYPLYLISTLGAVKKYRSRGQI